jgi:hypothetical protein
MFVLLIKGAPNIDREIGGESYEYQSRWTGKSRSEVGLLVMAGIHPPP